LTDIEISRRILAKLKAGETSWEIKYSDKEAFLSGCFNSLQVRLVEYLL